MVNASAVLKIRLIGERNVLLLVMNCRTRRKRWGFNHSGGSQLANGSSPFGSLGAWDRRPHCSAEMGVTERNCSKRGLKRWLGRSGLFPELLGYPSQIGFKLAEDIQISSNPFGGVRRHWFTECFLKDFGNGYG